MVIGNGMYNMALQYPSIGEIAFAAGVIDKPMLAQMESRQRQCVARIASAPADAGLYCERVTVYWLFSAQGAGELFYYDVGLPDARFFDDTTRAMGRYLNRDDVKAAVHAEGARWVQADEKGPVADALLADWAVNSDVVVGALLRLGHRVNMYNGVRDLSSCNHIGNEAVLDALCKADGSPCAGYPAAPSARGRAQRPSRATCGAGGTSATRPCCELATWCPPSCLRRLQRCWRRLSRRGAAERGPE